MRAIYLVTSDQMHGAHMDVYGFQSITCLSGRASANPLEKEREEDDEELTRRGKKKSRCSIGDVYMHRF